MRRVFLVVLDSVGIGQLPDAEHYGDVGCNTLGHIIEQIDPSLPHLQKLGLGCIEGVNQPVPSDATGVVGRMAEKSAGKDTTTGHWEMMGITLPKAFPTFLQGFPSELIQAYEEAIGHKTIGNYASSGTAILDELGEEHLKTGCPIVYTSADSVFQIACHEDLYPPKKLYELCEKARALLVDDYAVGRVIARPFVGTHKGAFTRTGNRRDFSLEPIAPTLLDSMQQNNLFTMGVGKIEDIFCMRGLAKSDHAAGNPACIEAMLKAMDQSFEGMVFVNLVDFDMVYGHRRDVQGYADCLVAFDEALPKIQSKMKEDDLLIITADHGCDPAFHGTDHTREYVPMIAWHQGMKKVKNVGTRDTFADLAATIAQWMGLPDRFSATSFADCLKEKGE